MSASAAAASGRPTELDARLQELAGLALAQPEDRPGIGVRGGDQAAAREVRKADRDRVFRAQAEFGAGRILRHEHPPPDVLARQVDEHVRRLEHRRLDALKALLREQRDQGLEGLPCRH